MTELTGRKPLVDMVHHRASLRSDLMQDADEIAKAQIRDFAPPQRFHPLQVERFEHDAVILRTELLRQIPVERLTHMGDTLVDAGQRLSGSSAVVGAALFPR